MASETIHSGHFMKSDVHDAKQDDEDEDEVVDVISEDATDADAAKDKPVTYYKFGPKRSKSIAIDVSLGQLNRFIHLSYNQLTTPKWKDFTGLRLPWKHRIRLNNVIWRGWHMECAANKQGTPYCFFELPEVDVHKRVAGDLVFGMYWKRRLEAVCASYKRWRHFYSSNRLKCAARPTDLSADAVIVPRPSTSRQSQTPALSCFEDDDLGNCFTDRLFDSLNQPYMFPNPKEMAQLGNADIIQPSLLQLQPSLDDIMNSLDQPLLGEQDPLLNAGALPSFGGSYQSMAAKPPSPVQQYSSRDYLAASLLVEYGSQQPALHSAGSLPGAALPPVYSQALADSRIHQALDLPAYSPQLATLSPMASGSPLGRSGWLPLASPVWSPDVTPPPPHAQSSSPSKGALKAYPPFRASSPTPRKRPRRSTTSGGIVGAEPLGAESKSFDGGPGRLVLSPPLSARTADATSARPPVSAAVSLAPTRSPLLLVHSSGGVRQLVTISCAPTSVILPAPVACSSSLPSNRDTKQVPILPASPIATSGVALRPTAPAKRAAADSSTVEQPPGERKRVLHLHAEQSRRTALKDGFEQLTEMLPNLYSAGSKPTSAVVLAKGAEYVNELKDANESQGAEIAALTAEVDRLKSKIRMLQTNLPLVSQPSASTSEDTLLRQNFARFVKERAQKNGNFWMVGGGAASAGEAAALQLSQLMEPLFASFVDGVSGETAAAMGASAAVWARDRCQPVQLRFGASDALVHVATNTPLMNRPDQMADFIAAQVNKL